MLKTLNPSSFNSRMWPSPGSCRRLMIEALRLMYAGPTSELRVTLPKVPGVGLTKAAVLNHSCTLQLGMMAVEQER